MRWANGQQKVNLAASIVVPIIARFLCAAARISHRSCCGRVRRDKYVFSSSLRFLALGGVQHHFCAAFGRACRAACAAVRAVSYSAAAGRFERTSLARKGCNQGCRSLRERPGGLPRCRRAALQIGWQQRPGFLMVERPGHANRARCFARCERTLTAAPAAKLRQNRPAEAGEDSAA
jgi:hypothetical protein